MTIGVLAGTFDLLHPGHLATIAEARGLCDHLVIALHVDPNVERPEKHRPIERLVDRALRLRAALHVNEILPYETEADLEALIIGVRAGVIFAGNDHEHVTGAKIANVKVVHLRYKRPWSSSALREEISRASSEVRLR